jgi:hypothetical protein
MVKRARGTRLEILELRRRRRTTTRQEADPLLISLET